MLYRRHLRIKALQALYSFYTGGIDDLVKGEKELLNSISKVYELFIWQLSFMVEVKRFAAIRMEENKKKFYPTEEDLNPNFKFVNNRVLNYIEENKDFQRKEELFKINWFGEQNMIRKFNKEMRESDYFVKYMNNGKNSLEDDKIFMIKFVDLQLSRFDLLRSFYEEKSVYFSDGYDLVTILLIKFVDTLSNKNNELSALPEIYKASSSAQSNDDKDFLRKLYRKVILNNDELNKVLQSRTKNWDFGRIPLMDLLLLKMAIVELTEMPTIPVKVTLNEYIELAKYFSTSKSKAFVNGVLDKLIRDFKEEGKIKKLGRGLVD
ncbi:MAG: transcription antitermination factor NusB [Bacteroidetes bacterium]|nr:MAG: transcription antitermination factor NusB [Bacteroidota bacterium]